MVLSDPKFPKSLARLPLRLKRTQKGKALLTCTSSQFYFYRMWAILFWISVTQANLLDPSKKGKKDIDANKFANAEKTIER